MTFDRGLRRSQIHRDVPRDVARHLRNESVEGSCDDRVDAQDAAALQGLIATAMQALRESARDRTARLTCRSSCDLYAHARPLMRTTRRGTVRGVDAWLLHLET